MADNRQDVAEVEQGILKVKVSNQDVLHLPPGLCRLIAESCEAEANSYFRQIPHAKLDKPLPDKRAQEIVQYLARQGKQLRLLEACFRQYAKQSPPKASERETLIKQLTETFKESGHE